MSEIFYINEDDRLPSIEVEVFDASGAVNLSGATSPVFYMEDHAGTAKVSGSSATITGTAPGKLRYDWGATDTDTPGIYRARFQVTVNSLTWSFPNNGYITVVVQEKA